MGPLSFTRMFRLMRFLVATAIVLSALVLTPAAGRADVDLTVTPSLLDVAAQAGGEAAQPVVLEKGNPTPTPWPSRSSLRRGSRSRTSPWTG